MYKAIKEGLRKTITGIFNSKELKEEKSCHCRSCRKLRKENQALRRSREGWRSKYQYYKGELKSLEQKYQELKKTDVP